MIELEKLEKHIQSLKKEDWDKLFSLLPEIEATKEFGSMKGGEVLEDGTISLPYSDPSEIVDKVFQSIHDLNIVPVFDWITWEQGQSILDRLEFDHSNLDTLTLCKLLTVIVRSDRFNDGYFMANFENGNVPKIIRALKQNLAE